MKVKLIGTTAFIAVLGVLFGFTSISPKSTYTAQVDVVDIEEKGGNLLEKLQGQWLGINSVAGIEYNWFVWDYRAIAPSQLHGIHEGGSMGNLFNTFYIADFKGKKTIMARNGGVLNGIYRSSYFVMDRAEENEDDQYYRLVDAVGGKETMYMELRFTKDSLYWNAYTSQLGNRLAERHMTYKGKKYSDTLAQKAAKTNGFPDTSIAYDFPKGFDDSYLYIKKTATFLWQEKSNANIQRMGEKALDPITPNDYPYVSELGIDLSRSPKTKDSQMIIYVSEKPLTDAEGRLSNDVNDYNNTIHLSYLTQGENHFKYTYLHPGDYFVTLIADMDSNYIISPGDLNSSSIPIQVLSKQSVSVTVSDISKNNKAFVFQNLGDDFYKEAPVVEEEPEEVPVIDWEVSYQSDVKRIIRNNCITCHGGPAPDARLDLTEFKSVKMAMQRKGLLHRINDKSDPMPPKKMLSLKDRMIIFKWKKDGLKKK
ncbi:hypothetical protein [Sediminicola luteus]|uniref:Cytochrome c domain-containing protein n=1 Tax=Sediminicola luteus TaxID=319238 RepID=A0A2A4G9Y7_9FLAO|nr:hypothetical protein [Sediminicola luteus]PCE64788.1 hypothetical protein B7P33_06350 [Sediminicola luteus]